MICINREILIFKEEASPMTGTIAVIMVFGIPLTAIITSHFQKQSKIKANMLKDELELEKLKHINYLAETEKMKLELEQMKIESPKDEVKFL
jgi:hypothetical protein